MPQNGDRIRSEGYERIEGEPDHIDKRELNQEMSR